MAVGLLCGLLAKSLGLRGVFSYWGTVAPLVVGATLVGALLWNTRARALLEFTTAILACLWMGVAFTPLCRWMVRPLVRADRIAPADAIFVLSSNVQYDDEPSPAALSRGTRGLELLGEGGAPRLYLSELGHPAGSYRAYLQGSARRMGVAHAGQIFAVGPVQNTHDEALRIAALFREKGWRRLLLVTSPTHSRRAAATFERAGVPEVISVPAVETLFDVQMIYLSDERIEAFGAIAHEWLGLWVYALRGWT